MKTDITLTGLTPAQLSKVIAFTKTLGGDVADETDEEETDEDDEIAASKPKKGKGKKAAAVDEDEEETEDEGDDEEEADAAGLKKVRLAFKSFVEDNSVADAKAILKKFKAKKIDDLSPSDYSKVIKLLK